MMKYKGIILAGGTGTRLYPATLVVSKHLLPIYDKPMIYYPISTLMLAGIRDMLIICTPQDVSRYQQLLGTGEQWGVQFDYAIQPSPDGLAQALIIGERFIDDDHIALILGDNIFHGRDLSCLCKEAMQRPRGASIFAYHVQDPERYGVVEFDESQRVLSLEEKPKNPRSNYAVTGLYFYDQQAIEWSKSLKPSRRKELEITDLNKLYLEHEELNVQIMDRGCTWLDTGTHESLLEAVMFVSTLQKRQGLKIACLEEIAYRQGWITDSQLEELAMLMKSNYGQYLHQLLI